MDVHHVDSYHSCNHTYTQGNDVCLIDIYVEFIVQIEGGDGDMKNGKMRLTSLPCVHVWLHEWYESTSYTTIEMKRANPFEYNESKCSL